jgi:hypothetical protein
MKSIICLAVATALVGTLVGCEPTYNDRYGYRYDTAPSGYGYGYGYPSSRTYQSRDDYYRHYNGIGG